MYETVNGRDGLLWITTCDTWISPVRRGGREGGGQGRGASSVSQAWRSGCGENPISSLLSFFLPANGTKAQKSIYPWKARIEGGSECE